MANEPLQVEMLGGFSVSYRGQSLISRQKATGKANAFLQYVIFHRREAISKERLLNLLYGEDRGEEASNTIRVTIHRLNRMFEVAGAPGYPYIISSNGMCSWSDALPCQLDVDAFEANVSEAAREGTTDAERSVLLMEAVRLYKGEFLAAGSAEPWIAMEGVRLKKLYIETVTELCGLLMGDRRMEEAAAICAAAAEIYPYDEVFYAGRIRALLEMGDVRRAVEVYETAVNLFFKEMGVEPGEELTGLQPEIAAAMPGRGRSLEEIRDELNADNNDMGAFYCNYLVFMNNYRYAQRLTERTNQPIFLMLCSLTDVGGGALEPGERLQNGAAVLGESVKHALRRGDLYTRYAPGVFLVMLMDITQENCAIVSQRIDQYFRRRFTGKGLRVKFQFAQGLHVEQGGEMSFRHGEASWQA